jgi:hypothetical protein
MIANIFELLVELSEWVACTDLLNLLRPDSVFVFVDVEEVA